MKNEAAFQKQLAKIGEKLAELRKKKGYTSHETFAYDYDLSRVQYWRIEKGKSNLTLRSLCNLLEIHGIGLKDFFNSLPKD
ncbi:MAG: helix-turn-helix transcriptional regulator [Cyclobacteriaceae bacterium]|nr:helix-turn-helix transcriptional regulator [Cyclobacteriaceae bacterium]